MTSSSEVGAASPLLDGNPSNLLNSQGEAHQKEEETEEEMVASLKFYVDQLQQILKPVTCCILLSVFWVKVTIIPVEYFSTGQVLPSAPRPSNIGNTFGSVGGESDNTALITAGLIAAQIVVATFVIMFLIKYKKMHLVVYFFGFVVFAILGYFGYVLVDSLLLVYNITLDWISLAFFLWNFVNMGLACMFWKGPMLLQQIYLVLMSSMMAFNLSRLDALVTWILLSFLAVWGN
jgi:presenilin 1